jgi:hypothetical protein
MWWHIKGGVEQLGIQLLGIVVIAAWVTLWSLPMFCILRYFHKLRYAPSTPRTRLSLSYSQGHLVRVHARIAVAYAQRIARGGSHGAGHHQARRLGLPLLCPNRLCGWLNNQQSLTQSTNKQTHTVLKTSLPLHLCEAKGKALSVQLLALMQHSEPAVGLSRVEEK